MNTAKLMILKDTFEKQFSIERFKKFTREFFNEPEMLPEGRRTGIWKEYLNHINSYYTVARYTDNDNNNLIVLAVELKKDSSIDRARSMQRNFISKVLDENNMEAAIVAFYTENDPSWRLSLVRLDYSFKETGISLELTPARRYSYLLGKNEPNITAQAQLLPIFENDRHNPTLDEIENAFSVEKVTKDFYSLYEEKYFSLKEYLEADPAFIAESEKLGFEVVKFSEQFAKKLMGQLAFLYFLQKKGWLGVRIMPEDHTLTEAEFRKIYTGQDQAHKNVLDKVFKIQKDKSKKLSPKELFSIDDHEAVLLSDCFIGTDYDMPWGSGNKTFIREIFDFCITHTKKNFFNDYLEPFFYEALNTKRKNQYFKTFNCKIPFLNGGLFEPLEGYHWQDVEFEIPNELFSNKEQKGREADGILDIFDRFNFTINEDEPLEKEVAVDPEMLGKIFENLLDVSDRKSKGAFYTPREIVHYMCQESLINYLVNEVNVPYEDIKQFIIYGELIRDADSRSNVGYGKEFTIKQSIYDNIVKIDDALKNVKVADPAVGSGAFPLGMLNEIVKARNNITEYIIRKDNEGFFDRKFGEPFIRKWRAPYKMKWDTIRNSIFAVDIEPSAVDIAKLRLWLSVVVEQEINEDNPEPHPLPNLDMNIHVGNSLIDEYEGIKLFDKSILSKKNDEGKENAHKTSETIQLSLLIDHTDEILKEMFALQDRYFDEDNEDRKKDIKAKIDHIRDELIRYKLQRDNNTDALKRYTESLKNKTKPYFIWEMEFAKIFKEKGGFDIVIGNPPYVRHEKIQNMKSDLSKYAVYANTADLLVYFFERGNSLIKQRGFLCLITSNKYMRAAYGKQLRYFLKNSVSIKRMIDFKDLPVFDAAAYPAIFLSEKEYPKQNTIKSVVISTIDQLLNFPQVFDQKHITFLQEELKDEGWVIDHNENNAILKKAFEHSVLLGDLLKNKLKGGIKTGLNEAFIIDSNTRDQFIYESPKCSEVIKPYIVGRDIKKYKELNVKKYLICTPSGWTSSQCKSENKWNWFYDNYKPIANHFIHYEEKLKKRSDQGEFWWELRSCDYYDLFNSRKIIYAEIAAEGQFTLDEIGVYCDMTAFMLDSDNLYILGLLNSKLMTFIFSSISSEIRGGFLRWKKQYVNKLPIAIASEDKKEAIADLVNNINQLRKSNKETTNLEMQIDHEVYELYGLTDDEIKIIEGGIDYGGNQV